MSLQVQYTLILSQLTLPDFIHNFTDGMAIAASYSASLPVGIATTVAVFIHEIPHEIGDMAILITSGVTFPKVGSPQDTCS